MTKIIKILIDLLRKKIRSLDMTVCKALRQIKIYILFMTIIKHILNIKLHIKFEFFFNVFLKLIYIFYLKNGMLDFNEITIF